MAATNSTTNLGLPQWEATDKPERTDFNTANSAVDAVIGSRTYTEQNYVTDSESVTDSLDALDMGVAAHEAESVTQVGGVHGLEYEEGVWTPYIQSDATHPTTTYVDQVGRYKKIGQYVYIECILRGNVSNVGSGNLRIVGLPIVVPNTVLNGVTLGFKNLLSSTNYDIYLSGWNVIFSTPTSTLKTGANYYLTFSAAYSI